MNQQDVRYARHIERRVLRFSAEHALLPAGTRVLLAVSGGPDSLALLHILGRTRERTGLELTVAYVDHRLRPPEEVAAERAFVAAEAEGLGLPFVAAAVEPVPARRRSPEDAARRGRYRALARLAAEVGAARVATGHTRTDQAETVLIRMLRGAGLYGLGAMRPESPWPVRAPAAPRLVRPLLQLDRAETEVYCRLLGLAPRSDPENANPRYLRNRVRRELLPVLRALNPRVESVLAELADEVHLWRSAVESRIDAVAPIAWRQDRVGVDVDVGPLRAAHPVERHVWLRAALQAAQPERPAPSRAHLRALDRLVLGHAGAAVALPGGVWAWRERDLLRIGRAIAEDLPALGPDQSVPVPGVLRIPGWQVRTQLLPAGAGRPACSPWTALLDAAAVAGLTVGARRRGERIEIAGMQGRKRLQDLFVDAKVPRAQRDRTPVFRTERGVVWVGGLRIARWAQAGEGPVLVVELRPA